MQIGSLYFHVIFQDDLSNSSAALLDWSATRAHYSFIVFDPYLKALESEAYSSRSDHMEGY